MRSWLHGAQGVPASNWPARFTSLCGLLVIALAVTVIVGWHVQNIALTQIRSQFPALQYLSAVGFLLCGVGLVAFGRRMPRILVFFCGGVVGGAGLLLSLGYLTGAAFGFDLLLPYLPALPGHAAMRPSPPTSVCFFFCGCALALMSTKISAGMKRPAVWVLGSLVLALCFMALCGYLTGLAGTYVWGPFIGMAFHTAVGMGVLAAGLLATQLIEGEPFFKDRWLPVPVAVAGTTAALVLWQALVADRYATVRAKSAIVAQDIRNDLRIQMDGPLRALERMKLRWDVRGGTPFGEWKADAIAYVRNEKIFDAIEWVDPSLHVRWVVPEEHAAQAAGLDLTQDTRWNVAAALDKARQERRTVVSPTLKLKQGGNGFLVYAPLFPNDRFDGFLVGVFRVDGLMRAVLKERSFQGYSIWVFEGGSLVDSPQAAPVPDSALTAESTLDYHGHRWRFVISPRASSLFGNQTQLPHIVLILALLLSAALTIAVFALQLTKRHSVALQSANRDLESEVLERKKIERRLRESEERLRAVLDSATGVSVISCDMDGLVTYFSKGSERLLGYAAADMVGKMTPAIIHDPAEVATRAAELSEELGRRVEGFEVFVSIPRLRGSERREWTYICKDGSRRTVDLIVTVLDDPGGGIVGFLGTAFDITERKEMEHALRETVRARETAQALLEAAGRIALLGHWELPSDGSGPAWSDITCAIHEVPPGTRVSVQDALNFFCEKDRPAVRDHVRRARLTGEPFEFESRLITARNREIWVHLRGEPVRDEEGAIVALRGVIQNIDDRRRAAELLERRNQQLEIARAQAEAHARAKAEFLANMSHEIRTPLNAVVGMSDLLMDSSLPAHERELIETIRSSGDVLLALINDILDFSKIESGQLELERIAVPLRECVESALDLVANEAEKKKLDLVYWIDRDVPAAFIGDVTRFRQIIVNLVSNAIKFTNEGEVFVNVSCKAVDGRSELLHVTVRDTGIGIPAERLGRLFQAFSQVDTSTTRRYGGTGLGLAISRRIVEMMEGRIWVESEFGKGSTFQFEVPIEAVETRAKTQAEISGARSLEGLHVLIVDDNATNRWILQMQAETWGMVAAAAGNAAQALERIDAGDPFALAILDVMMPDMDGYALAAEIRKRRSKSELPILMLTSMGDRGHDLRRLGISGVLAKPIKTAPLYNAVAKVLGDGRDPVKLPRLETGGEESLSASCPLHVLVAEDNVVNQRVVDLLLQRLGYRPVIVANGLEALTASEATKYDVILLDVQMPEMDGFEVAREICRRHPVANRPWMIALTAHAVGGDRDECLAAGMDDYLSKPIRSEGLESVLRRAFDQKKA